MDKVTFSFDIINKNIIKIEDKNFKINNDKRELYIQDPEWNKKFIDDHILNKSFINVNNTFMIQTDLIINDRIINILKCYHGNPFKECHDGECKGIFKWFTGNGTKGCNCNGVCNCHDYKIRHFMNIMRALYDNRIICLHGVDLTNNFQACGNCQNNVRGFHVVNDKLLCEHNKEDCEQCRGDKNHVSVRECWRLSKIHDINYKRDIKVLLPIDIDKLLSCKNAKFVERIIENELKMKVVGVPKEQFDIVTNIGLDLIKFKPISVYYYLELYMNDIIINKFEQFKDHVVFEVKSKNIIDKLHLIEIFDPIYYKTLQKQLLLKKGIIDDIKVLFKYAE